MQLKVLKQKVGEMLHCAKGDPSHYGWYSDEGVALKDLYHRNAKAVLKHLAEKELGLRKDQYDLRTNKAGPASLGETTLHTDTLYVQMGGLINDILIRSCSGRKDYHGGMNNFFKIENLATDWDAFMNKIRACDARTMAA